MAELKEVYAVGIGRTPVGDFLGSLSKTNGVELGTLVANTILERAGIEAKDVDEIVLGMVYKHGNGGNPARQIQSNIGAPMTGWACTVEQLCGSAMRATEILAHDIMLGKTDIGLVLGAEVMSQVPYILKGARTIRMGDVKLEDALTAEGLNCRIAGYHMGCTAENLAEEFNISREEQDELACISQERAATANDTGIFKDEMIPVPVKDRKKGTIMVERDEHPRATTMENLAKLPPAFKKGGTVTAGNASGINDGAAGMVLVSGDVVKERGLKPIAKLVAITNAGVEAERMGYGPAVAVPKVLDMAGLTIDDIDYYELNEAFAAQFLAVNKALNIPMDKVNANGSGIAIGHPVGCTGVRIQVSMMSELKKRGGKLGCASLCVGGGPALACVWEMCD